MKGFLIILTIILILPGAVYAQSAPDLSITSIPMDPKPGETVRLTVQSYAIDLSQATVAWRYNNSVVTAGTGRTTISVVAPGNGQIGTVNATVNAAGISPVSASIVLRPASMDVLWEAADSYTPPFFKGKALPLTNSLIRVTAIPAASAPKNVSFAWKQNDAALPAVSGYNHSSITIRNSELIDTETFSVGGSAGIFSGSGTANVPIGKPSLIGYKEYDGFIDYANGSTTVQSTTGNGMTLRFEPYYFSVPSTLSNGLEFVITAGDEQINTASTNALGISRPENGGTSILTVTVNAVASALQDLTRTFTVSFY